MNPGMGGDDPDEVEQHWVLCVENRNPKKPSAK